MTDPVTLLTTLSTIDRGRTAVVIAMRMTGSYRPATTSNVHVHDRTRCSGGGWW